MNAPPTRVFVVEDEALIAMEIRDRLTRLGYAVCGVAARGETAIGQIANARPDLVLMDINLAGELDGIETAARLHEESDVPVVFLTAYSDDALIGRATDTEPFGYLVKPFEERELHATIQMALYKHRMERALRDANASLEARVSERTAQLAASEARLKEAQQIGRIGDLSVDLDSGTITWSDALFEIFGRDPLRYRPTLDRYYAEIVHPDDVAAVRREEQAALQSGRPHRIDHRFLLPDGTERWLSLGGIAEFDAAGRPLRLRGTAQDITARKRAEIALRDLNAPLERRIEERTAALAESERFNRATLDSIGAHLAVLDGDGRIVTTNTAWRSFAADSGRGWAKTDEGANYLDACDGATGDSAAAARAVAAGIRDVIAGRRRSFALEYPCHSPAGEHWLLCRVARFAPGGPTRVVVSHDDVTLVHQALEEVAAGERMFASLALASPVGIFRTDAQGHCEYVNRRWCEIAGTSEAEALGEGWARTLHPADRDRVFAEWTAAVRGGAPFRSEYRFQQPDGTFRWVTGQAIAIADAGGGFAGHMGTLTDVTEIKEAELALRAREGQLQRSQRMARLGHWIWRVELVNGAWHTGLRYSETAADVFGVKPEELAVPDAEYLSRFVHPDDRAAMSQIYGDDRRPPPHGRPIEYRILRADGSTRHVVEIIEEVRARGDSAGEIQGMIQDVTERKQVELAMQTLSRDVIALEGAAYFEAVALRLATLLDADMTFVTRLEPGRSDELRTVALTKNGALVANMCYPIAGTPCAEVVGGHSRIIAQGVQSQYPDDHFLVEKAIESYAAEPLIDHAGRPLGHVGVMGRRPFGGSTTIATTLKMFSVAIVAEMERQRNRRQYEDLFEFAPGGLLMIDRQDRIALVNRQAERLFGWTRAEMIGQPVEILVPPDLRQDHLYLHRQFQQSPTSRPMGADRPSLRGLRKDGSEFPAEIDLAPVESEDGTMIAAAVRDISARQAVEAELDRARSRLQALFDHSPFGISIKDSEGRYVMVNPAAEGMIGAKREDMLGRTVHEVFPNDAADVQADEEKVLRTRQPVERVFTGFPDPSSEQLFIKFPIADKASGSPGIGSIGIDLTERRRLEAQLREMQKMDALGKLTGGLAHDFNNYLAIIIGNLDLVKEHGIVDPGLEKLVDAALRGALRSAQLTKSLLAFSRRQTLDPLVIDVNERMATMVELLKRTLGTNISISLDPMPNLWPVKVDGAQLDSCIVNLAANARDAMPRGGGLAISTRNVHLDNQYAKANPDVAPGDYVLMEVADTGTGMSPEAVARAFEPFFTTKGPGHGTGLGLSMVYGFVKQSGGHIKIYSEPGHGTVVRLYLPRDAQTAGGAAAASDAGRPAPAPGGAETVLLVEDDEEVRYTAESQLASLGYRVIVAAGGEAALALLNQGDQRLDLLFTDIVMPGKLDGYELARRALDLRPDIRVLLSSGFPGNTLRDNDGHAPHLSLLGKPYRKDELARAVRKALDSGPAEPRPPA